MSQTRQGPRRETGAQAVDQTSSESTDRRTKGASADRERAGLDLIDEGRHVFILGPTKRPVANCDACRDTGDDHDREACPCLLCHGFYAATGDPDRYRAMLDAVPGGMLAVRTGRYGPRRSDTLASVVVVDIDPRHDGTILPDLMPVTRAVATGSGGWHLWYRYPDVAVPCSAGRVAPGVDIRADGGYAVCPPSVHPRTGRPYRWVGAHPLSEMPSALVLACQPVHQVPATTGTRSTSLTGAAGISRPDRLLSAILERVTQAPEGTRRNTLYGAARGVARMVAAGAITTGDAWSVLTDAGRTAGQSERDIRRAVEGGFTAEGVRP